MGENLSILQCIFEAALVVWKGFAMSNLSSRIIRALWRPCSKRRPTQLITEHTINTTGLGPTYRLRLLAGL